MTHRALLLLLRASARSPLARRLFVRAAPVVRALAQASLVLGLGLGSCSSVQGPPPSAQGWQDGDERPRSAAPPVGRVAVAPPTSVPSPPAVLAAGIRGFCVHGGAPLVGAPLVDRQGRLYLVTRDGYLHAYEEDGRYRFSYTVAGIPVGSPSLRESDGAVLLGTTARAVYGIGSQGQLFFRAHTVTPVWSGLHAQNKSSVVYLGLTRFLYALSNHGAALYRVAVPGQPVGEPVVGPDGTVWVPLDSGLARFEQAFSVKRWALPGPAEELALGGHGPLVLSGGTLYAFDASGTALEVGEAEALLGDGRSVLALDAEGGGRWLDGGDPARSRRITLPEPLRAGGPGDLAATRALVPLGTGEVAEIDLGDPEHPAVRRRALLHEPLTLVAFTPQPGRLLVTSISGRACLLDDPFLAARAAPGSR